MWIHLPVAISHSLMVLSRLPESANLPLGLKDTLKNNRLQKVFIPVQKVLIPIQKIFTPVQRVLIHVQELFTPVKRVLIPIQK